MHNYWVVGASWGGVKHQDQRFVENNIWLLGYSKDEDRSQYEKAKEIKKGDRIAIKRMMGQGAKTIKIKHIGIVTGIIPDVDYKVVCSVNWLASDLDRIVEARGCFKSVHKFSKQDSWIREVFCL